MAILHSLPGVEVTVWSKESRLEECHDFEDEVKPSLEHKTVSKYIQSETDAEFYFVLKVGEPYEHDCDELGFFIILDGCEVDVDGHLCSPGELAEEYEWEREVRGMEMQDAEGARVKKFRFSKVHKTDDYDGHLSKRMIEDRKKIGQIEVRVHQLSHGRAARAPRRQLKDALDTVPEKIFNGRAVSHNISYGEVETLPEASKYTTSIYMHGWDNPLGIFRFKYRSRNDLQKELIISRTPTPEPHAVRNIAELTTDQRLRLARMKYDDMEMLRSLTITHNVTAGQNSTTPYRSFEGLTEDEIHALAMQKHAEMTGVPFIKPEPAITIKIEPGSEPGTVTNSSNNRRQPYREISAADGHPAINLTADDDDANDESNPLFVMPWSSSKSKSRDKPSSTTLLTPYQTPKTPTSSSRRKARELEPDEDELAITCVKRCKKGKTWGDSRPFVKKEQSASAL